MATTASPEPRSNSEADLTTDLVDESTLNGSSGSANPETVYLFNPSRHPTVSGSVPTLLKPSVDTSITCRSDAIRLIVRKDLLLRLTLHHPSRSGRIYRPETTNVWRCPLRSRAERSARGASERGAPGSRVIGPVGSRRRHGQGASLTFSE